MTTVHIQTLVCQVFTNTMY